MHLACLGEKVNWPLTASNDLGGQGRIKQNLIVFLQRLFGLLLMYPKFRFLHWFFEGQNLKWPPAASDDLGGQIEYAYCTSNTILGGIF